MDKTAAFKSQVIPMINNDFWMTVFKASAAISYVCYGKAPTIQQGTAGIKEIAGTRYKAQVAAVAADGSIMSSERDSEFFAFVIAPEQGPGDFNAMVEFEQLLIQEFRRLIDEDSPIVESQPKDFQVHKADCYDDSCQGCDE